MLKKTLVIFLLVLWSLSVRLIFRNCAVGEQIIAKAGWGKGTNKQTKKACCSICHSELLRGFLYTHQYKMWEIREFDLVQQFHGKFERTLISSSLVWLIHSLQLDAFLCWTKFLLWAHLFQTCNPNFSTHFKSGTQHRLLLDNQYVPYLNPSRAFCWL